MDAKEAMEEIRDIYLDPCELDVRIQESRDEDGVRWWKEFESSKKQDLMVEQVIIKFEKQVVDNIYDLLMEKLDK